MSLETMSNNRNIDSELSWKIIETYFKGQHLGRCIRHQLESYNDFTRTQIQKTIDMFNPVTIHSEQDFDPDSQKYKLELIITFTNFHIYRPQIHENNGATKIMYPQEARMRNFTYASAMTLDLDIKIIHRSGEKSSTMRNSLQKTVKDSYRKITYYGKISNLCFDSKFSFKCGYNRRMSI